VVKVILHKAASHILRQKVLILLSPKVVPSSFYTNLPHSDKEVAKVLLVIRALWSEVSCLVTMRKVCIERGILGRYIAIL